MSKNKVNLNNAKLEHLNVLKIVNKWQNTVSLFNPFAGDFSVIDATSLDRYPDAMNSKNITK